MSIFQRIFFGNHEKQLESAEKKLNSECYIYVIFGIRIFFVSGSCWSWNLEILFIELFSNVLNGFWLIKHGREVFRDQTFYFVWEMHEPFK